MAITFLPIVDRELRTAARLPATYRNRTLAAGLILFAAMLVRTFTLFASNSQVGVYMFSALSFLTMVFCVLEGVRKTADCLSEEKREGTLGLLFLTDLRGYDVVLGKLAGTSLNSVYGLFAILPALSLPLLVGGVMPGEFWRMALALANILFFSLSAGMLVSARCRQESRAMGGTLFLILAFLIGPEYFGTPSIALLSPLHPYRHAFALVYPKGPDEYWLSLGVTQAVSWLMLACASLMLPRWWHDAPGDGRTAGRENWWVTSRKRVYRQEIREEMLATNPAFWLAARGFATQALLWILIAGVIVASLFSLHDRRALPVEGFIAIVWFVNFIVKMRVATQACHCLAEARRNNALEMLLATPLTVNEIINGQILALKRIFALPVVALIVTEFVAGVITVTAQSRTNDFPIPLFFIGGIYIALFILDLVAVTWAGMWFGLTAKKEIQAVTKTILLVLVLPYVSLVTCWFAIFILIGMPIFWIAWASSRLRTEFRTIATQRYSAPPGRSAWLPARPTPSAPPVISS